MIDERFYGSIPVYTLQELLSFASYECVLKDKIKVQGLCSPQSIRANYLSFLESEKYLSFFNTEEPGIVLTTKDFVSRLPKNIIVVAVQYPKRVFIEVAKRLYPSPNQWEVSTQHKNCRIHATARIHPTSLIGEGVEIGECSRIEAGVCLGRGVKIGKNCHIHPQVTISHSIIEDNVEVCSGARIGQSGFGFVITEQGPIDVPHLGRVLIGEGALIGANTTIDRGSLDDTVIGAGSRLDNLVQIAHNVKVGDHCVVVAQVGIAGSTELGARCIVGGQVGIIENIKIGSHVQIAAQSGVMRSVPDHSTIGGAPAVSIKQWMKQNVLLAKLAKEKKGHE